jgi:uncharacterized protein
LGQLVFDSNENIYTCFEASGNSKAKVGNFKDGFVIDENKVNEWKSLNSYSSKYCNNCSYRFVCAGGCPWHTINQGKTECLPIKQEITLAWNYYADKVIKEPKASSLSD